MNVAANIGLALACTAALVATAIASPPHKGHAPYAGQESGAVSALSAEEIDGLRAGLGLGLAKPAELNGYPGPLHALELAAELRLSEEQTRAIRATYETMKANAKALGAKYIEAERSIDDAFRSGGDAAAVATRVAAAERLRAELRLVHLTAHLEITPLLTPDQRLRYAAMRGYGAGQHYLMHRH